MVGRFSAKIRTENVQAGNPIPVPVVGSFWDYCAMADGMLTSPQLRTILD